MKRKQNEIRNYQWIFRKEEQLKKNWRAAAYSGWIVAAIAVICFMFKR